MISLAYTHISTQLLSQRKENTTAGGCAAWQQCCLCNGTAGLVDEVAERWHKQRSGLSSSQMRTFPDLPMALHAKTKHWNTEAIVDMATRPSPSPRPIHCIKGPIKARQIFWLANEGWGLLHFWQLEHCRLFFCVCDFFKTKQTDSSRIVRLKWGTTVGEQHMNFQIKMCFSERFAFQNISEVRLSSIKTHHKVLLAI